MSVQFVIGRAGSGKTRFCIDRIVEAMRAQPLGDPILWILPKQATFEAERMLAVGSGLDAFLRCRVVSFEELGREVLAECGGDALPAISAYGRQMILRLLLRKHAAQLRFFASSAHQPGLAARIDRTFADFERAGKGAEDLAALLEQLQASTARDADAQALADKVHDLHLLYAAYGQYLGQDRLDPHRRLRQVLTCIETWPGLRNAAVYVDGFLDFSDYERSALAAIATVCRALYITILGDPTSPAFAEPHPLPHELGTFHRTERAYQSLRRILLDREIVIDGVVRLDEPRRAASIELARVEAAIATGRPLAPQRQDDPAAPATAPDTVTLLEAPTRRAEADAAAMCIRRLLRDGLRLREIAVLMRSLDDYHELIDASFREHQIPYFADRRRAVAHHPLLQLVRSALLIARHEWPQDAVLMVLKSGLTGLSFDEIDELENYALEHRIRGSTWASPEPWTYSRGILRDTVDEYGLPTAPPDAQRADELRRRLTDPLKPLVQRLGSTGAQPLRAYVAALCDLLERLEARSTLGRWITEAVDAQALEQAGEHEQVWSELMDLLDQMVDLLGDEPVTLDDFLGIFDAGLEQFDLALTPPTVDQVIVGSVDRTRTYSTRAVIVLGLNDGMFPRSQREDSILSDIDRRTLRDRAIEIEADSERRLLDENLLAYLAFTRASERLIVLRSIADDAGREAVPSPYWHDLRAIVPEAEPTLLPRAAEDDPRFLNTPRQLVTSLMRWACRPAAAAEHAQTWPALYQWLAVHEPVSDAVDIMRFRAWKALSYNNEAALEPDTATSLFAAPLRASVRQIEIFAECPFRHFARYGLRLEPRHDADPTLLDLSSIYHQTLDKLVTELLRRKVDLQAMPAGLAADLIGHCTREVGQRLRGELMISSARNRHLLARIETAVNEFAASQKAAAAHGAARPRWTNLTFGGDRSKLPALSVRTPAGHEVSITGHIDRVDLLEKQAAFAVIDYRMGASSGIAFDRVYHGLSLQLLASLLVIQAHGEQLAGAALVPAAALYVRLLRQFEAIPHPADAVDPEEEAFHLWSNPRGIINQAFLAELDRDLAPGQRSKLFNVSMNKDGSISKGSRDVTTAGELQQLLELVKQRLAVLADQVIAGDVRVAPYRLRDESPCARCEYGSLCRFQPGIDGYRFIDPVERAEVLGQEVADD